MVAESLALAFFHTHGYWILFLLLILDGSVAALAGLAASSFGIFNIYIVFVLAIFGGLLPDTMWFFLGKAGRKSFLEKHFGKKIEKFKNSKIKKSFEKNIFKTILVIKFTPYMPIPGFILAGSSNLHYKQFMFALVPVTMLHAFVFTFGGYFFGRAFLSLFEGNLKYIGFIIAIIVIVLVLSVRVYKKFSKWAYRKIEELSEDREERTVKKKY